MSLQAASTAGDVDLATGRAMGSVLGIVDGFRVNRKPNRSRSGAEGRKMWRFLLACERQLAFANSLSLNGRSTFPRSV